VASATSDQRPTASRRAARRAARPIDLLTVHTALLVKAVTAMVASQGTATAQARRHQSRRLALNLPGHVAAS
jgi:hypothetical protein